MTRVATWRWDADSEARSGRRRRRWGLGVEANDELATAELDGGLGMSGGRMTTETVFTARQTETERETETEKEAGMPDATSERILSMIGHKSP